MLELLSILLKILEYLILKNACLYTYLFMYWIFIRIYLSPNCQQFPGSEISNAPKLILRTPPRGRNALTCSVQHTHIARHKQTTVRSKFCFGDVYNLHLSLTSSVPKNPPFKIRTFIFNTLKKGHLKDTVGWAIYLNLFEASRDQLNMLSTYAA